VADRRKLRAQRLEDLVPTDPGTLGRAVLGYLEDLEVKGYSGHSIRGRRTHLRYFVVWCDERGLLWPAEITPAVLQRYQRWLYRYRTSTDKRLSFRTQNDRLGSVKRFFRWLVKQQVLEWSPADALELPRIERRLPKAVLSVEEAERVLAQPDVRTRIGIRDRAILETLYSTGIRRQELVDLEVYSVDLEGGTLMVRQGKGRKDRMIPIGERALQWLERYLDQVRPSLAMDPDDGRLFLTTHRAAFSPERMSLMVREYVDAAGIGKRGSCHLFRHTMATLMLEGGADIRFIQAMLGHADLSTTQIYTRVAIRKLKEVHELTHPGARLRRDAQQTGVGSLETGEETAPTREELLASLAAEEEGELGE
jgi:integrase/recombinase XerD